MILRTIDRLGKVSRIGSDVHSLIHGTGVMTQLSELGRTDL